MISLYIQNNNNNNNNKKNEDLDDSTEIIVTQNAVQVNSNSNSEENIINEFNKKLEIDSTPVSSTEKIKDDTESTQKPKKKKPMLLSIDTKKNDLKEDDPNNILLSSPLYRKKMESLNMSSTKSLNSPDGQSPVPNFNISIKDLKNKFEHNKKVLKNSQDNSSHSHKQQRLVDNEGLISEVKVY